MGTYQELLAQREALDKRIEELRQAELKSAIEAFAKTFA